MIKLIDWPLVLIVLFLLADRTRPGLVPAEVRFGLSCAIVFYMLFWVAVHITDAENPLPPPDIDDGAENDEPPF